MKHRDATFITNTQQILKGFLHEEPFSISKWWTHSASSACSTQVVHCPHFGALSMLALWPKSGRYRQLRRHLAEAGDLERFETMLWCEHAIRWGKISLCRNEQPILGDQTSIILYYTVVWQTCAHMTLHPSNLMEFTFSALSFTARLRQL